MRMIGQLDTEAKARNFGEYLYVQGIDNQIERDKDGTWSVWIHREEDLDRGRALLNNFSSDPNDPRFQNHSKAAEELREQKRREQEAYEKRVKKGRQLFPRMAAYGVGPVTFVLIFISVVVFIDQNLPGAVWADKLFLTTADLTNAKDLTTWQAFMGRVAHFHELFPEVRSGEVWRLITPIFLHFSFLHIFFNMLWLRDLGSMIEGRQGSLLLIIQVLVIAVISNVAQYFFDGWEFGGMSGVVYGLFGYIWIRGRMDRASGLFLHQSTVWMMIIWLFACMIGVVPHVANAAHGAGILVGMAWGWLSALLRR